MIRSCKIQSSNAVFIYIAFDKVKCKYLIITFHVFFIRCISLQNKSLMYKITVFRTKRISIKFKGYMTNQIPTIQVLITTYMRPYLKKLYIK